jgi:hypothetical protein
MWGSEMVYVCAELLPMDPSVWMKGGTKRACFEGSKVALLRELIYMAHERWCAWVGVGGKL